MFFDIAASAAKKYAAKPTPFIYAILIRIFAAAISLFASLSIIFLAILTLTTFGLMGAYGVPATAAVALGSLFLFAYLWAAYKGAMIKSLMDAEIGPVHMHDFLRFAVKHGPRFFAIFAIKNFFILLFNLPMILAFVFLKLDPFSQAGIAVIALMFLVTFTVKFLFSFADIAAAVKGLGAIPAVTGGMMFVAKNPLRVLGAYALYTISILLSVIPLIPLITLYPISYLVMINLYRSKSF